ncbi:MAG: hypothetical protein Ta2B_22670 [Termitinemataceae bacterium]|nr:MAG: hypothetical protein Ta2B_22670 [Termitinemataceae bacterium]
MKKYSVFLFLLIASLGICIQNIFAQDNYNDPRANRFYFDSGIGIDSYGLGLDYLLLQHSNTVFTLGTKTGWGPIDSRPMFIILEFDLHFRISTVNEDNARNISPNILFLGPGIVFYVSDDVQAACSLGVDFLGNYRLGFSGNISFAYDFSFPKNYGRSRNGILLGINLFSSTQLKEDAEQTLFGIGLFIKYTYRTKDWPIFWNTRE